LIDFLNELIELIDFDTNCYTNINSQEYGEYNSNSHFKNWFSESQPQTGFQKTNFMFSSAYGAGKHKIGFITRIAVNTMAMVNI
jgi:hypothetical protein